MKWIFLIVVSNSLYAGCYDVDSAIVFPPPIVRVLKPLRKLDSNLVQLRNRSAPFSVSVQPIYASEKNRDSVVALANRHGKIVAVNRDGHLVVADAQDQKIFLLNKDNEVVFYWNPKAHIPKFLDLTDPSKVEIRSGAAYEATGFASPGALLKHFDRHRNGVRAKDSQDYERRANLFANYRSSRILCFTNRSADYSEQVVKFDPMTREILVLRKNSKAAGYHVITYFKDDGRADGDPTRNPHESALDAIIGKVLMGDTY